MTNKLALLAIHITAAVLLLSMNVVAQDRDKIQKDVEALRNSLKLKEQELLRPSDGDWERFSEFLQQPDTGLARLMPREKFGETLTIRGGGAYYSFSRRSNNYDYDAQIGLEQGILSTGFSGADFGFLTSLGNTPLEEVNLASEGTTYLAGFAVPGQELLAREQQRRTGTGFTEAGHTYKRSLPAVNDQTYLLRSIGYDRFDVLVAFRVVRQDTDGSVIVLWKKLKEFPVTFLVRGQSP